MTRKDKIRRAIRAIENRELRGFSYFTGNGEGSIDRDKPCCSVGALILEAGDEFAQYLDMLFAYNQTWLFSFHTIADGKLLPVRDLLTEIYGLTPKEQSALQSINDDAREANRKDDVLFYLNSLLNEEDKTNE